ncbi:MAG: hypothetical protein ACPGXK_10440 [Phycisphaerae bacterium]
MTEPSDCLECIGSSGVFVVNDPGLYDLRVTVLFDDLTFEIVEKEIEVDPGLTLVLSTPELPSSPPTRMAISDNYVWVADFGSHLSATNIEVLMEPQVGQDFHVADSMVTGLTSFGDIGIVSTLMHGILAYSPTGEEIWSLPDACPGTRFVAIRNDILIAGCYGGVELYRLSNSGSPELLSDQSISWEDFSPSVGFLRGDYLIIHDSYRQEIRVFDISALDEGSQSQGDPGVDWLSFEFSIEANYLAADADISDDYLAIALGAELRLYDLSSGETPILVVPGEVRGVSISADQQRLYATVGSAVIEVEIGLTEPRVLEVLGVGGSDLKFCTIREQKLLMTSSSNILKVISAIDLH